MYPEKKGRNADIFCFSPHYVSSVLPSAGQVKLVLTLYKNLGSFLTTQNSTLRLGLGLGQGPEARRRSLVVNSHVISASVHRGSNRVYLSEPVIFTLRHLQVCLEICLPLNECSDCAESAAVLQKFPVLNLKM